MVEKIRSKKEKKTMKQMIQNLNKNKLKKLFPDKVDRYYALEMPEKYFTFNELKLLSK